MAESYLDMIFRTKKEGSANKEVATELDAIKDKSGSAGDAFEMLTGSSLSAAGAFGAVAAGLKYAIGGAMEAETANANLAATLKSTGGAVGMTADQIMELTDNLAQMSGQDDKAIQNANSMLLTFTQIGKDVFPMAAEAVVNMGAKFGNLETASIQVGKALNDPVAGVTALRKVGVMLTDAQEASIKAFMAQNDVAGAQKVILGELQTEFGGLAAAMGNTTQGSINKLKISLDQLAETVGGALTPALKEAADTLNLLLTADKKTTEALDQHKAAVVKSAASYEEYVTELIRTNLQMQGTVKSTEEVRRAIEETGRGFDVAGQAAQAMGRKEFEVAQGGDVLTESLRSQRPVIDSTTSDLSDLALALQNEAGAYMDSGSAAVDYTAKLQLTTGQVSGLVAQYGSLTQAQIYNQLATGMSRESALKLGEAMGLISPQVLAARDAMDALNQKYAVGERDSNAYRGRAEELAAAIAKLHDKTIEITTYYNEVHQALTPEQAAAHNPQGPGGPGGGTPYVPPGTIPTPVTPWTPYSGETGDSMTGRGGGINIGTVVLANSMDMETFKRMLVEALGR